MLKYTKLIPQNIAPKGATGIGVYESVYDADGKRVDGKRVGWIPLGPLAPEKREPLFSFGLVSDIHVADAATQDWRCHASAHFDAALTFFEKKDCAFCAHAGDITLTGFWRSETDTSIYLEQFGEYKRIRDLHPNMPVLGIAGNHESYYKPITDNTAELTEYTGHSLYHEYVHGDHDVFLFVGQPASYTTLNEDGRAWLSSKLTEHAGKRCHVFIHVFPPNDSGNPNNCYSYAVFGSNAAALKTLLADHGRAILYHGHSHVMYRMQEYDKKSNYCDTNGYPSVHVPSVSHSMGIKQLDDGTWTRWTDWEESQGAIVDVYDDCIVINGWNFNDVKPEPHGTIKINI